MSITPNHVGTCGAADLTDWTHETDDIDMTLTSREITRYFRNS